MKKLITAVLMTLFVTSLHTQWVSNHQPQSIGDLSIANAKGISIAADNSGYCYITGYSNNGTSGNDILTIKYTPQGDTAWVRTFNGTADLNDQGFGIAVDASGNIYVAGVARNTVTSADITLLKYDQDGNLQWQASYSGTEPGSDDGALGIVVDQYSNIYITGYSVNAEGYSDITTLMYNTYGNLIWSAFEDGDANLTSKGTAIALDRQGNICVSGYVTGYNGTADIAAIKYDIWGNLIWSRYYNGTGGGEDKAFGIAVDDEDRISISGYATNDNVDAVVLQYSSDGTLNWHSDYNGSGNSVDKAFGIAVDDEDGVIYISGFETDASGNTNYLTMRVSPAGVNEWVSTYNGTGDGNDKTNAIALLNNTNGDDFVIVTGESMGSELTMDYTTVKYLASNGTELKVSRYSMNSNSDDAAQDIAVTDEGRVFVTGFSDLLTESNVTSSYSSTLMYEWGAAANTTTGIVPDKFALYQNYPNPFNPSTNIKFEIGKPSAVKLEVYDILGKVVSVLVDQNLNAGTYNVSFTNSSLATGVYFYRLTADGVTDIKKMTLIK